MHNEANTQLEAIRSMISAGQRCIRMERHSLILWGVTGGILCIATDFVITEERFGIGLPFMTALLLFLGIVLSGAAVTDFHFTRYRKTARGESFPFIHAQISKVWLLFMIMGLLFTFGSGFFGGSYMTYGVWLILVGLGLFVHGLFSEQMLEWAGVIIIFLGICPLAMKANYEFNKWLAASVLGLGLPALSFLLDGIETKKLFLRMLCFTAWLLLILLPPLSGWHFYRTFYAPTVPSVPTVPLQMFLQQKSTNASQIVTLPTGTKVPVRIRISGNIFLNGDAIMPLVLSRPVEIALEKGKPTGHFRFAGEKWKYYKHNLSIWGNDGLKAGMTPVDGPFTTTGLIIKSEN